MFVTLVVSTLFSAQLACGQGQTPPAGANPPPVVAPNPAMGHGKAPTMLPPPSASDMKIKGDECAAEAKTAGCKDASVNQGLLQCMMGYKKAHHEFAVSPGCRVAIQKWHMSGGAKK